MSSGDLQSTPRSSLASRLALLRELGIVVLLAVIFIVAAVLEPRFLSASSIRSIFLWVPLLVVVAMGEMMVIVTRGVDVSVGSILGFVGISLGMLFRAQPELSLALAVVIALALGAVLGAVNGVLIAWLRVPPIITTLGTLSVYRGLTFIICDAKQIDTEYIPSALVGWSSDALFGIPVFPVVMVVPIVVALVAFIFLRYTRTGRNIYAIGGNPEAAHLRGLPVRRTIFLVYTLAGAMAGLAGLLYASRYGLVNPGDAGKGFELTVIAAVVIGGVNVFGGSGTVPGVVLGCLLLGTINVVLSILGIEGAWQMAVYGAVILFAVIIDHQIGLRLTRAATAGGGAR